MFSLVYFQSVVLKSFLNRLHFMYSGLLNSLPCTYLWWSVVANQHCLKWSNWERRQFNWRTENKSVGINWTHGGDTTPPHSTSLDKPPSSCRPCNDFYPPLNNRGVENLKTFKLIRFTPISRLRFKLIKIIGSYSELYCNAYLLLTYRVSGGNMH